jgi:SAM-dependent methyltransferase
MDCPPGLHWLDVGCGTGALSAAILERCAPAQVSGVEPSRAFRTAAQENLGNRAALYAGSATEIPLQESSVDVVVSGLVLNFVADSRAALIEMTRVARSGGSIGAYVWDYAGKMELIRLFFDAAVALDPGAAHLDEGVRFPVCNPNALRQLFASVGLQQVETGAVEIDTNFASFDEYWRPFLAGQGPAPAYTMSLPEDARARLRERLASSLPTRPDGSISLTARAWAVRGRVAKD